MASKDNQKIPLNLPNELGNDFSDDRKILKNRPTIEYEEPDAAREEDTGVASSVEPETIEEARQQVQEVIDGYKQVEDLADLTQKRVDERVGNYSIQLDQSRDSHVIDAIGRCFPEAKDKTKISYEMYKQCLSRINNAKIDYVSQEDILEARKNPLKTDFAGYGNLSGMNRNEISSPANVVEPVNLKDFQNSAIPKLFDLLKPLVLGLVLAQIIQHKLDTPHF